MDVNKMIKSNQNLQTSSALRNVLGTILDLGLSYKKMERFVWHRTKGIDLWINRLIAWQVVRISNSVEK